MPPPRGTPNSIEGPGDYDVTTTIHNDTYAAISPLTTNLTSKAVLITGASRGLGRAITLAYASAGASYIAAAARSSLSALEIDILAAAKTANRPPPKFLALQLDITSAESVAAAAERVEKEFGHLDIVINNAGVMSNWAPLAESDVEVWWRDYEVNLKGPALVSRYFLPLLLKGGDKVLVFVASVGAHLRTPGLSSYQGSKMAVLRLCEHLAMEYREKGVTTFAIHPGNVVTDMIGGEDGVPDDLKAVFVDTPEISGHTLVYLTKEKRQWLSGRYINVTWDMPELMAKEDEIVKGDKLRVKLDF